MSAQHNRRHAGATLGIRGAQIVLAGIPNHRRALADAENSTCTERHTERSRQSSARRGRRCQ